jgi:hypothetical protein
MPRESDREVLNRFDHHAPTLEQQRQIREVRLAVREAVRRVLQNCPDSADRTVAIRDFRRGLQWAVSSIVLDPEGGAQRSPSSQPPPALETPPEGGSRTFIARGGLYGGVREVPFGSGLDRAEAEFPDDPSDACRHGGSTHIRPGEVER